MSLNWSTKECNLTADMYDLVDKDDNGKPLLTDHAADVRQSLVFHMWFVGVGYLKDAEAVEKFYARYVQFSIAQGTPSNKLFLKFADVAKWQGISCNGGTLTDAAFAKKIRGMMEEYASVILKNAKDGKE